MVEEQCCAQQIRRADYRFSRRAVREHTRWGDTQLKIHLARLVELEYLLIHRGGRGQSFEYELVFDGEAHADVAHVSGLLDVEALKQGYDAERSGLEAMRSGPGRPTVGGQSVGGRGLDLHAGAENTSVFVEPVASVPKTQGTEHVTRSTRLASYPQPAATTPRG
jgi:hypothetical protein